MANVCSPDEINKWMSLLYKNFHSSPSIWSASVLHHPFACVVMVLILILGTLILYVRWKKFICFTRKFSYPVHDSKVHPHSEHSRREVNSFGNVRQELVVETLYRSNTYLYTATHVLTHFVMWWPNAVLTLQKSSVKRYTYMYVVFNWASSACVACSLVSALY